MSVYLLVIFYSFFCFSRETFELYQPSRDRQFLCSILKEHAAHLLDVIPLEEALTELEDSSQLSILKLENIPIGFINYCIFNKTLLGFPLYQYGFINGIAVASNYQKMGYGKKLVQYCINELEKDFFPYVRLQVKSDNQAAIGFYCHLGFKKIEPSVYRNSIEYYQFELQLR